MPEKFGIFCKSCGSYEVDIYLTYDDEIIAECKNKECNEEEEL